MIPVPAGRSRNGVWRENSPRHSPRQGWSHFDPETYAHSAESFLKELEAIDHAGDIATRGLNTLQIAYSASGRASLWESLQCTPHVFSVGGLVYEHVKAREVLVDKRHYTLPHFLPHKRFRYSAVEDRLELCLEPYGHFAVAPDIERIVGEEFFSDVLKRKSLVNGSSDRQQTPPHPISSQDIRRPTDLPPPIHHRQSPSRDLSILEEDEQEEEEASVIAHNTPCSVESPLSRSPKSYSPFMCGSPLRERADSCSHKEHPINAVPEEEEEL